MARGILIVGESGSGKSSSIETLDPKTTFIINVKGKDLPFRSNGSYKLLNKDNPDGNYISIDNANNVINTLNHISDKMPHIETVIIDDFQYISATEFMSRIAEKSFDKFNDIGKNLYTMADLPRLLRPNLNVYYMCHAEESTDMFGSRRIKAKTLGKLIDNVVTLEGLFTMVLYTDVSKSKDGMVYSFITNNNGGNTAKSPKGMFPEIRIPNDLNIVNKAIKEYYN